MTDRDIKDYNRFPDETRWVDASIRWSDYREEDGQSESSEEGPPPDPFATNPSTTFDYCFEKDIKIHLKGYKMDSDPIWKSTGLTVWRAAEHLGQYLVAHADELFPATDCGELQVLELGAGLGLCGILAYRLLQQRSIPSRAYVTDGDTDALAALRENVALNQQINDDKSVTVFCHQLLWGRATTEPFRKAHGRVDVLLASDIVYAAGIIEPLWETVDTLLPPQGGYFLFAYCSRRHVPVSINQVLHGADAAGFGYELVQEKDGIILYKFTRN